MKTTHKYIKIKNYLRKNISEGKYTQTGQIESEHELADYFSVSRMTVRRAIRELQSENIVKTIQGKGTFVTKRPQSFDSAYLISYLEQAIISGYDYYVDMLSFSSIKPSLELKHAFKLQDIDELWEIKRVHYFQSKQSVYEEVYIPLKYAKDLSYNHSFQSLFNYLEDSGHSIESSKVRQKAIMPNLEVRSALDLSEVPIIVSTHNNYDINDNLIEISYSYFHPTNYVNEVDLKRKKIRSFGHKILLICHEGMVSSNIELRINQYIHKSNLNLTIQAKDPGDSKLNYNDYSAILIEPRFRFLKNDILSSTEDIYVEVISMENYSSMNEEDILANVISYLNL